jgi:hypothetical protein
VIPDNDVYEIIAHPGSTWPYEIRLNGKEVNWAYSKRQARGKIRKSIRKRRKLAKAPKGVIEKWTVGKPGKEGKEK